VLLRSLLFNVALYVNFLVQAIVFSPVLLLPERMFWPIGRFWVASTLWLHRTITGIDDDISGRENIPGGGFIVASKHQSAWETLRLTQLFPRPSFILKKQLLWLPLFGWYMKKAHMIPVDRGKGSVAIEDMLIHARRAIAEGRQIIIFPEGTRRPPFAPPDYRRGVTRLYAALHAPCLPIALNSGLYWPRRSLAHRRGTIRMQVLPAIPPGLPPEDFAERLQTDIETAVKGLLSEIPAHSS
jgi:1-acyl-sn-glycerol-3-phosphate acyltransferase